MGQFSNPIGQISLACVSSEQMKHRVPTECCSVSPDPGTSTLLLKSVSHHVQYEQPCPAVHKRVARHGTRLPNNQKLVVTRLTVISNCPIVEVSSALLI